MMRIGAQMQGRAIPDSMRKAIEERAEKEGRIVLRLTPEQYYP
jgi:hypothetical protein